MEFKSPSVLDKLFLLPRMKGLHRKLRSNVASEKTSFRCNSHEGCFMASSNNYFKGILFMMLYFRKDPDNYNSQNDEVKKKMILLYLEQVFDREPISKIEKIDHKIIELIEKQNKDKELTDEI